MLTQLLHNIWLVLLDTAFWLLIGLLAAGLIKVFIPPDAMRRWVGGRGLGAILRAALFGAPLPLCSCGVLPAAIGLHRSGASKEATVSFLISTPETSVDSVAVTWALMGPLMAVYRPVAALLSAVITGLMTTLVREPAQAGAQRVPGGDAAGSACCGSAAALSDGCDVAGDDPAGDAVSPAQDTGCCSGNNTTPVTVPRWLRALQYAAAELLDDIALWLVVGIVLAGALMTFVPEGWMAQWGSGLDAMLMMLVVGIPLYICAVASTPVAAGLLLSGVSPGVVLVFLLVGPATNIASFALVRRELGNAVTTVYFFGIASVSLVMGLLLEWLLAVNDWQIEASLGEAHQVLPAWLTIASAALLLVLGLRPVRRRLLPVLG